MLDRPGRRGYSRRNQGGWGEQHGDIFDARSRKVGLR